jgi:hypothetical protein
MPYLSAPFDLEFFTARHAFAGMPSGIAAGWELFQTFQARAEALPEQDDDGRRALGLLAAAAVLDFHPSSRSKPFRVMMQGGSARTADISDFGPADVETFTQIAASVPELGVRARVADVAWEAGKLCGKRNWNMGVLAAHSYAQVAAAQLLDGDELVGRDALQRGLELGWQFRKQAPEVLDSLWRLVETTARAAADRPVLLNVLADECIERHHALAGTMAPLLEAAAQRLLATVGPALECAELWARAARLWQLADQPDRTSAARLQGAQAYVDHAEAGAADPMFAAHWMKVGLESLRQAGADAARIAAIHERVLELQLASTAKLRTISQELDVRPIHDRVMSCVSGKTFEQALFGLARMDDLARPEQIRKMVLEQAQRSPLSSSISHELMNIHGHTIGRRGSLLDGSEEERETALQLACFEHAGRWDLTLRGDVMVPRAAQAIYNEHHPTESDVARYIVGHPFVPETIQVSVIRGLCHGFEGDWLAAGAYLIPRMEALVRHWLQRKGVVTSAVGSDGFQAERPLTELFKLPEAREYFDERLLFELRCHLTEKWGFDLRNKYAHGLAPDGEVASSETLSLWWLLWRVLLTPLLARETAAESTVATAEDGQSDAT